VFLEADEKTEVVLLIYLVPKGNTAPKGLQKYYIIIYLTTI